MSKRLVLVRREDAAYRLLPWWVELVEDTPSSALIFLKSVAAFANRGKAEAYLIAKRSRRAKPEC